MDFKDLLQFQLVSQVGQHGGSTADKNGGAPDGGLYTMARQLVLMALIGLVMDLLKALPDLFKELKSGVTHMFSRFCKDKMDTLNALNDRKQCLSDTSIALNTRHGINTFAMMRVYNTESESSSSRSSSQETRSEESNGMVDAVLAQLAKLANVPSFSLVDRGQIMIAYKDKPIQMTRDIYCKIDKLTWTAEGSISSIKLTLMSNALSAAEITSYAKGLYEAYLEEMKNSLGAKIYFFDQKSREGGPPPPPPPSGSATDQLNHRRMVINTAPKQLSFTMTPFYSNKQFSNIFGQGIRDIEKRVEFFLKNREWYDDRGVPYQLGLLLSGVPGAGKTSVIRAIANRTKRHIINVNFANISTATQLKNLFYSDKLQVYTDTSMGSTNSYFIPIDQRLYVLEEVDAIGDIVRRRSSGAPTAPTLSDELTLAEILTVLDGTMESPGRIMVMTTNHPKLLDPALIRPGRIDVQTHFGYANQDLIAQMFQTYLDVGLSPNKIGMLPDNRLTPAEVGQVLFRHFGKDVDEDAVISDMVSSAEKADAERHSPLPARATPPPLPAGATSLSPSS